MKIEKIDVWIDLDQATSAINGVWSIDKRSGWVKAKLIIELPEKSITLTESDFDLIVGNASVVRWKDNLAIHIDNLKRDLGF